MTRQEFIEQARTIIAESRAAYAYAMDADEYPDNITPDDVANADWLTQQMQAMDKLVESFAEEAD